MSLLIGFDYYPGFKDIGPKKALKLIKTYKTIEKEFLLNTLYFKRLPNCKIFTWNHDLAKLQRKLRIYLYKAYRIALIFKYNRAIRNSEILISLMQNNCKISYISHDLPANLHY
ncbi:MAG: hypothetical protein ACFFEY_14950 [Candidatus Thorarchaeota archaeon]